MGDRRLKIRLKTKNTKEGRQDKKAKYNEGIEDKIQKKH
jgi:hypothetical protein